MYLFYLKNLLLPIAPESFSIKYKSNNKTISLINGEEINIPKHPGLSEISFKCIIPRRKYPFAVYDKGLFLPLEQFTRTFKTLIYGQVPFLFVIKKIPRFYAEDLSMRVTMESYEILDEAVNGDDVLILLNLKEYVNYSTKSAVITEENQAVFSEERPVYFEPKNTYIVKQNDTLWKIAKTNLGDGGRYREIYQLNREAIEAGAVKNGKESSRDGHFIFAGLELLLP